jgi:hypothetical protein
MEGMRHQRTSLFDRPEWVLALQDYGAQAIIQAR